MGRRKNVKRIDPRYFLNETVNRNDDGSRLEEDLDEVLEEEELEEAHCGDREEEEELEESNNEDLVNEVLRRVVARLSNK